MTLNSPAVVSVRPMIISGKDKTYKFCPRCSELKPVSEFGLDASRRDGLMAYCKKCRQEYYLMTGGKKYSGLHKRPFPPNGSCEICGVEFSRPCYHHWDDNNLNLGTWVCHSCDCLVEGLDEIERNPWKGNIYRRLKKEVGKVEETFVCLGPFLPPDGIYKLFYNNKQTYKWCPHCGRMRTIKEFNKNCSDSDGLQTWCSECLKSYKMGCSNGYYSGLHKRPKPDSCELCGSKAYLAYHHWDGSNKSKGLWVCGLWSKNKCHHLAEAVDRLDNSSLLPSKYSELKQGIIELEVNKVLLEVV